MVVYRPTYYQYRGPDYTALFIEREYEGDRKEVLLKIYDLAGKRIYPANKKDSAVVPSLQGRPKTLEEVLQALERIEGIQGMIAQKALGTIENSEVEDWEAAELHKIGEIIDAILDTLKAEGEDGVFFTDNKFLLKEEGSEARRKINAFKGTLLVSFRRGLILYEKVPGLFREDKNFKGEQLSYLYLGKLLLEQRLNTEDTLKALVIIEKGTRGYDSIDTLCLELQRVIFIFYIKRREFEQAWQFLSNRKDQLSTGMEDPLRAYILRDQSLLDFCEREYSKEKDTREDLEQIILYLFEGQRKVHFLLRNAILAKEEGSDDATKALDLYEQANREKYFSFVETILKVQLSVDSLSSDTIKLLLKSLALSTSVEEKMRRQACKMRALYGSLDSFQLGFYLYASHPEKDKKQVEWGMKWLAYLIEKSLGSKENWETLKSTIGGHLKQVCVLLIRTYLVNREEELAKQALSLFFAFFPTFEEVLSFGLSLYNDSSETSEDAKLATRFYYLMMGRANIMFQKDSTHVAISMCSEKLTSVKGYTASLEQSEIEDVYVLQRRAILATDRVFGMEEWKSHFGKEISSPPALPSALCNMLLSQCLPSALLKSRWIDNSLVILHPEKVNFGELQKTLKDKGLSEASLLFGKPLFNESRIPKDFLRKDKASGEAYWFVVSNIPYSSKGGAAGEDAKGVATRFGAGSPLKVQGNPFRSVGYREPIVSETLIHLLVEVVRASKDKDREVVKDYMVSHQSKDSGTLFILHFGSSGITIKSSEDKKKVRKKVSIFPICTEESMELLKKPSEGAEASPLALRGRSASSGLGGSREFLDSADVVEGADSGDEL